MKFACQQQWMTRTSLLTGKCTKTFSSIIFSFFVFRSAIMFGFWILSDFTFGLSPQEWFPSPLLAFHGLPPDFGSMDIPWCQLGASMDFPGFFCFCIRCIWPLINTGCRRVGSHIRRGGIAQRGAEIPWGPVCIPNQRWQGNHCNHLQCCVHQVLVCAPCSLHNILFRHR